MIEVVFATSIFAIVVLAMFQGFSGVTSLVNASKEKLIAIDLLNSEFELIRNVPYANVGLTTGIPLGVFNATSTTVRDGRNFLITRTIRNIDDPFDGQIGSTTNDLSPADYKMVELKVSCTSCQKELEFSANAHIAPKNLETTSTNGALFIRVFDANGVAVPQANVSVTNSALGVNINDTTNNDGLLAIVDTPPASNSYRIIATKSGFTTDRTYATSTSNPNPIKLDATVLLQQLTQVSFVIDQTSDMNIRTINSMCSPVPNTDFSINGTKLIGTSPDVFKWSLNTNTNGSGLKSVTDIEWDVFSFSISGGAYLSGTNPISPISVLPGSEQNIDLVISEDTPPILLVAVRDSSSRLPISGATVRLYEGSYDETKVTDQGFISQTDWSGGSGQLDASDLSRFASSDGNIEITLPSGEIKLLNSLGSYVSSGELTSSIFDTGTSSNWSRVDIQPSNQPILAGVDPVKFQIATSDDNTATTTWNFLGPDGTPSTFYTITNNTINSIHDNDRYIRYKIFLTTANNTVTPNISDVSISFASSCIPPGQVSFGSLPLDTYTLDVSATGYSSQSVQVPINSNWKSYEVLLSP